MEGVDCPMARGSEVIGLGVNLEAAQSLVVGAEAPLPGFKSGIQVVAQYQLRRTKLAQSLLGDERNVTRAGASCAQPV
jgi:hypothetical protein